MALVERFVVAFGISFVSGSTGNSAIIIGNINITGSAVTVGNAVILSGNSFNGSSNAFGERFAGAERSPGGE